MTQENNLINFKTEDNYIKIFTDVISILYEQISCIEAKTILFFIPYICYDDCYLRTKGRKNGRLLNIKDLSELSNNSYDAFRRTIYSLKKKGIIYVTKNENDNKIKIMVNPYIFLNGNKVEPRVIEIFKDSIWAKCDSETMSLGTDINNELRGMINKWKKDSMNFCDYKCVITGEKFNDLHHLYSFRGIIVETFANLGLEIKQSINDYTSTEKEMIRNELLRLHDLYGYGACLNGKVHSLFHSVYGINDFCYSDFVNFLQDINDGKYNQWFKDNKLNVDMNMNFLRYVNTINLLINDRNKYMFETTNLS